MSTLKEITTKAKALYKTGKYKKWTDAIKAASATITKTTKKAVKKIGNVTLKKANYHKNDERYIIMNDGVPHLEGKAFFKNDALFVADALRKVKKKRKAAIKKESSLGATKTGTKKHTDTNSHNVRINVVSGVKKIKQIYALPGNLNLTTAKNDLNQFENSLKWKSSILKSAFLNVDEKKKIRAEIKHIKGYILTLKNYIKKYK